MQKPINKNATDPACQLLQTLCTIAGKKIITGQHTQTVAMEEIEYIYEKTGYKPLLRGFELLSYSPNINEKDAGPACLKEVYENRHTLETALTWALETQGIVTMTFHWFSPVGGRDKSFYTENTDFDPSQVLKPDTPERKAFFHDMDVIAEHLRIFQKAGIPILWRPFHEAEGTWFWWGSKGPEIAKELYKLMVRYYIDVHHLDHLLWVWNCPLKEGYPGDDYVDVISRDVYASIGKVTDYKEEYEELIRNTTSQKVAALAEVGILPDIELLEQSHVPWAYYMTWSKAFCIGEAYNTEKHLTKMYGSTYSIKEGTF